jgi:hypothetical protein
MLHKISIFKRLTTYIAIFGIINFEKNFCPGPIGSRNYTKKYTKRAPQPKHVHHPTHAKTHHLKPVHPPIHAGTSQQESHIKMKAKNIKKQWEKKIKAIHEKLNENLSKEDGQFLSSHSKHALNTLMLDMLVEDCPGIKIPGPESELVAKTIRKNNNEYDKHLDKNSKHVIQFKKIKENSTLLDKLIEYLVVAFVKDEFTPIERAGFFTRLFKELAAGQIIYEFVIEKKDIISLAYKETSMFLKNPSNQDIVDFIIDKLIIYLNKVGNQIFSEERIKRIYIPACSIKIDKKSENYRQKLLIQETMEEALQKIIKIQTGSNKSFDKAVAPVGFLKKAAKWTTGAAALGGTVATAGYAYKNPVKAKELARQASYHIGKLGKSAQGKLKNAYDKSKGAMGRVWDKTKEVARNSRH